MNRSHLCLRARTFGISLALLALPVASAFADSGEHGIEGTWINEVSIVNCAMPQIVFAKVTSMTTFQRGGTVIESGGPATPPPAVSRSAGLGVWERTGHYEYQAVFRSHSFDALGRLVRITEVATAPTLMLGDNPATQSVVEPYYLSGWGTNGITNIDPVTGTVTSVTEGCNYATSSPMLLD